MTGSKLLKEKYRNRFQKLNKMCMNYLKLRLRYSTPDLHAFFISSPMIRLVIRPVGKHKGAFISPVPTRSLQGEPNLYYR